MENRHPFIRGTIILTATGLLSRLIGFYYRIFLSHTIGAEGMGIYQLIFPIYTLCFALTVFGIQTAISRFVAAGIATGNPQRANDTFVLGTLFSLFLSFLAAVFVHENAGWIGTHFLAEPRTVPLLQLLSFSIPMGAVHTCVNAYYYALKKTEIPAISQLVEQAVRVGSSYLVYIILLSRGLSVNAFIAVIGIIAGELASMLFSALTMLLNLKKQDYMLRKIREPLATVRNIITLSMPLTCNRVLLTVLSSIDNILIPSRLRLYGLSGSDALSLYGILSGMAMPLILFPSTITNSVSVMLLPSVAQQQALGENARIRKTIETTVKCCVILGVCCTAGFLVLGRFMGILLFKNETAGEFIRTLAFICPFLYLNTTLISILNGLGKTGTCFIHNVVSLCIRILFTFFAIPIYGIKGYLWGLLLGELTMTLLNVWMLYRHTGIFSYRQKKQNVL